MKNEKVRILLVEDEESIREGICDVLTYHGLAATGVDSGEEGLKRALTGKFALVILDVMLPGINGFDVCQNLREKIPTQPILMLTAKGSEDDVVEGFKRGADDYVTKPFSIRELVARVEALLRRTGKLNGSRGTFTFGHWQVDGANLRAKSGDRVLDLTPRELALLSLFAREKGRIVSRRTLLQEVWGLVNVDDVQTRTVDMHIAKLRKKVGPDGQSAIETVRGAGYRFKG
jgi:DNA-binding response OmpR family regulator